MGLGLKDGWWVMCFILGDLVPFIGLKINSQLGFFATHIKFGTWALDCGFA